MDIYDVAVEQRLEQLYGDIEVLEYRISICRSKAAVMALEKLAKLFHQTIIELEKTK